MELISKELKKHNFSAGPAILPPEVIEDAARAVMDLNGMGLSILEISHRSPEFVDIMKEAISLTKELLQINDEYEVLFLTGGASSQFFMTAMNLLADNKKACYIDTGSWSTKAIKEAKAFGNIEVLASSEERNFSYIPKDYTVPEDATYLHLTSNNTIYGTEYHWWPDTEVPFVCDMSSDIFSRPVDIKRFALIYAGAQKNMGPAGTTLVIVKKNLLGKTNRTIPTMLDYNTHIQKKSAFNTPPVYAVYVSMLTLRWLKKMGGVAEIEKINREKAALLYSEIDRNPCFRGTAKEEDRSLMNVPFVTTNPALEQAFMNTCKTEGIVGIKGHRLAGGFRASIYNAMPLDSVQFLVDIMKRFAEKHA